MKWIKDWLAEHFDHTLVLNADDPWLEFLNFHLQDVTDPLRPKNGTTDLAKIIVVPNCGTEGLSKFVYEQLNKLLAERNPPALPTL